MYMRRIFHETTSIARLGDDYDYSPRGEPSIPTMTQTSAANDLGSDKYGLVSLISSDDELSPSVQESEYIQR